MLKTEELKLVSEWDKTFPQSEKVEHQKVTFVNRYGITLAADRPMTAPLSVRIPHPQQPLFLPDIKPTAEPLIWMRKWKLPMRLLQKS